MSARNLLLFGILIAAAIGSWYLARVRGDEDANQRSVDPVHRGFYLKSARILGTGPNGDLVYEIRAKHAEEQLDGSIEFTDVRFDYSPETDVPWTVNADTAIILPVQPRVMLADTAATISDIEDRIAAIDYQLNDPDVGMSAEDKEIFWRERVRLMRLLVGMRYAQAQRTAF